MSFHRLSMFTLFVAVLAGCSSDLGDSKGGGTGDSGGGNFYKGRPLDSYVVDVRNEPAYVKVVEPILQDMKTKDQDLYRLFMTRITSKPWYFVPGPLQAIPHQLVGSAVPTEQGALQSFSAVWVDTDIYSNQKMSVADQGTLILHEILVGIKLLKYDSLLNQCLSFSPSFQYCDEMLPTTSGKPSDLLPIDYDQVRLAGSEIKLGFSGLSRELWGDLMFRHGFSFTAKSFYPVGSVQAITIAEIESRFRSATLSGRSLKYFFDLTDLAIPDSQYLENLGNGSYKHKSSGDCLVDVDHVAPNNLKFIVTVHRNGISRTIEQTDTYIENQKRYFTNYFGQWLWQIDLLDDSSGPNWQVDVGSRLFNFWAMSNSTIIERLNFMEMVCVDSFGVPAHCSRWTNIIGGFHGYCASTPEWIYKE